MQTQQRIGVVAQRGTHGRRQQRSQGRVQIAGLQHAEQPSLAQRRRVAVSGAVVDRTVEDALA